MTRTIAFILMAVALSVCLIGSLYFGIGAIEGQLRLDAAILGFALMFLFVVAPLGGFGGITLVRARSQASQDTEANQLRVMMDMVKTRSRVAISDMVIELKSSQPEIQQMLYKLVGMGLLNGYVNWDEGVVYSEDAAALHELSQCKHCGGNLTLAGKGIIKCPFCGTEYFMA